MPLSPVSVIPVFFPSSSKSTAYTLPGSASFSVYGTDIYPRSFTTMSAEELALSSSVTFITSCDISPDVTVI